MSIANVELLRGAYMAFSKGDVPAVVAAMAPKIVWNEAENFPYADHNPYVGPDAIVSGVFARLATEWDGFSVNVEEMLDAGDKIVARGRYTGTYRATGKTINQQFAHFWKVVDGKLASFDQYTDTLQTARAMGK